MFLCYSVLAEQQIRLPTQNETKTYINNLITNYNNNINFFHTENPSFIIDEKYFILYCNTGESFEVICVKGDINDNYTICFVFKKIASNQPIPNINFKKQISDLSNNLITISGGNWIGTFKNVLCKYNNTSFYAKLIIYEPTQNIIDDPNASSNKWAQYFFENDRIQSIWTPYIEKNKEVIFNNENLNKTQKKISSDATSNSYTYEIFLQDFQKFNSSVQSIINQKQIEIQNKLNQDKNNKLLINSFLFFVFNLIILLILLGILYYEEKRHNKTFYLQYWIIVIGSFLGVLWAIFISDNTSDYFQKGFPFVAVFIAFIIYFFLIRKKNKKNKDEDDLSYIG